MVELLADLLELAVQDRDHAHEGVDGSAVGLSNHRGSLQLGDAQGGLELGDAILQATLAASPAQHRGQLGPR